MDKILFNLMMEAWAAATEAANKSMLAAKGGSWTYADYMAGEAAFREAATKASERFIVRVSL